MGICGICALDEEVYYTFISLLRVWEICIPSVFAKKPWDVTRWRSTVSWFISRARQGNNQWMVVDYKQFQPGRNGVARGSPL